VARVNEANKVGNRANKEEEEPGTAATPMATAVGIKWEGRCAHMLMPCNDAGEL
jgi:hypothetical protein